MMRYLRLRAVSVWLCAVLSLLASPPVALRAQETTPPPGPARPRIGLALAGGGALGLAHVGVLQWLEENRIPIDAIAGTSMGGLVGGLYATGVSPTEMRDVMDKFPWETIVGGATPFKLLAFRRKEDRRNIQNRLEIGLKRGGPAFASGLNAAQMVSLLLSRYALPFADVRDFDDLPTRFRAVATDLGKGEVAVLGSGDLDTALRATIALPAIFTPVLREGRLLSDGAALQNLPTETAKAMGVDVVVAVDLTTPLARTEQLQSLTGVLGQSVAIAVLENVRRSLPLADIVLRPDLRGFGSFDFPLGKRLAERGYNAAEAKRAELIRYALPQAEWEAFQARRAARRRPAASTFVPAFIAFAPIEETRAVRSLVRQKANEPLNVVELESDLNRATGFGSYESLSYTKVRGTVNGQETEGLLVRVDRKPYGPPFLNVGIEANRSDRDTSRFAFATRITDFNIVGGANDELRIDARLGSLTQLGGEYYRRLGGPRFVAPRAFYNELFTSRFSGETRLSRYIVRTLGVGADIGLNPDSFRELRAGVVLQNLSTSVSTGSPERKQEGLMSALRLRYVLDGQDSATIPSRGVRWETEAQYVLTAPRGGIGGMGDSSRSFPRVETSVSAYRPVAKRVTLFGVATAGSAFGGRAPLPLQFTLGGPFRLGGFEADSLRGDAVLYGSVGGLYKIALLPAPLGGPIQIGAWLEAGGTGRGLSSIQGQRGASVALVADTILGPLLIGIGIGEGSRANAFFGIGRLY